MRLFARTAEVDAATVAERLAGRDVLVVDVRQPGEWRGGHIHGSINLPLSQLAGNLRRLPAGKPVVTVCASGHRSAAAARTLAGAGYPVENLRGGMRAWTRAGLPVTSAGRA